MENLELLLTDEYVAFSQQIADIHAQKKVCKEEFKKKYEEFQRNLKGFDDQAKVALEKFEEWKTQQLKNPPKKGHGEKELAQER